MLKTLCWIKNEESGQSLVEYSLILSLIVIVLIVTVKALGNSTDGLYARSLNKIQSAFD